MAINVEYATAMAHFSERKDTENKTPDGKGTALTSTRTGAEDPNNKARINQSFVEGPGHASADEHNAFATSTSDDHNKAVVMASRYGAVAVGKEPYAATIQTPVDSYRWQMESRAEVKTDEGYIKWASWTPQEGSRSGTKPA